MASKKSAPWLRGRNNRSSSGRGNASPNRRGAWDTTNPSVKTSSSPLADSRNSSRQPSLNALASANYRNKKRHRVKDTPQLKHQKQQWDMDRDIPAGTVRNNPFVPKKQEAAVPPQLEHKRRQWDARRDIPTGAVSAQLDDWDSAGTSSPRGSISPRGASSPRGRNFLGNSSMNSISSRGSRSNTTGPRAVEDNLMSKKLLGSPSKQKIRTDYQLEQKPSPRSPSSWEPEREIPKGVVRGRKSALFPDDDLDMSKPSQLSSSATKNDTLPSIDRDENRKPREDRHREDQEDPWIISPKDSNNLFGADWGKEIGKSGATDSAEEWDVDANDDWFRSSDSGNDDVKDDEKIDSTGDVFKHPTKNEEKPTTFVGSSEEHDREFDFFTSAAQKKRQGSASSNSTQSDTRDRDVDVLDQAARKKYDLKSHEEGHRYGHTFAYDHEHFDENLGKKQRKGILGFFSRGKKNKQESSSNSKPGSNRFRKNRKSLPEQHVEYNGREKQDNFESFLEEKKSQEEDDSNQAKNRKVVLMGKSDVVDNDESREYVRDSFAFQRSKDADDTTVSEMTNPTIFRNKSKEAKVELYRRIQNRVETSGEQHDRGSSPHNALKVDVQKLKSQAEVDPFDVNNNVFASGDPFGVFNPGEDISVKSGEFSDVFFPSQIRFDSPVHQSRTSEDQGSKSKQSPRSPIGKSFSPSRSVRKSTSPSHMKNVRAIDITSEVRPSPRSGKYSKDSRGTLRSSMRKKYSKPPHAAPDIPEDVPDPDLDHLNMLDPELDDVPSSDEEPIETISPAIVDAGQQNNTPSPFMRRLQQKAGGHVERINRNMQDSSFALSQRPGEKKPQTDSQFDHHPQNNYLVKKQEGKDTGVPNTINLDSSTPVFPSTPSTTKLTATPTRKTTSPFLRKKLAEKQSTVPSTIQLDNDGIDKKNSLVSQAKQSLPKKETSNKGIPTSIKMENGSDINKNESQMINPHETGSPFMSKNKKNWEHRQRESAQMVKQVIVEQSHAFEVDHDEKRFPTTRVDIEKVDKSLPTNSTNIVVTKTSRANNGYYNRFNRKHRDQYMSGKNQAQGKAHSVNVPPPPPRLPSVIERHRQQDDMRKINNKFSDNSQTTASSNEAVAPSLANDTSSIQTVLMNSSQIPNSVATHQSEVPHRVVQSQQSQARKSIPISSEATHFSYSSIAAVAPTVKSSVRSVDKMSIIRQHDTAASSVSLSSSHDIRKLRAIVRKPRKPIEFLGPSPHLANSIFKCYDETKIRDPMQRAGLRLLSAAVVPIQKNARVFLAKREALTRRWAILVIQAHSRRFLSQLSFLEHVCAAITIQAAARGMLARFKVLFEHCCAIEIQRHVRGYLGTMRVYEEIYKITIIQNLVRRKIAMEIATNRMVAVITIQAVVRGFLVRRKLEDMSISAITIQRFARGFLAQVRYYEIIYYITVVQNLYRMRQAIEVATNRMYCVITIQSIARGFIVRSRLEQMSLSAITMQRYVRGYLDTIRVYERIYQITLVQSYFRMRLATEEATNRMVAVISLQSVVRTFLVRRRLALMDSNAVVLQRHIRGYLATLHVYEQIYQITLVQNYLRMKLAMEKASIRMALIITLQALGRGWLERRRLASLHKNATEIQRHIRGYNAAMQVYETIYKVMLVQNFVRMKQAIERATLRMAFIITLQAFARGFLVRRRINNMTSSAIQIQRMVRGYLSTMTVYEDIYRVTLVQNYVRMIIARDEAIHRLSAVITIQAIARSYLVKQNNKYLTATALKIQNAWRCFYCKLIYQFDLLDIIIVQSVWRRKQAGRIRQKKKHERDIWAATAIQSYWRRHVCNMELIYNLSARKIQTKWRSMVCFSEYNAYQAGKTIQAKWRSHVCYKKYKRHQSAKAIQAKWRSHVCFVDYLRYKSATKIQAQWRCYVSMVDFMCHQLAIMIQTRWRSHVCSRDYKRYRAARSIQAQWRSYIHSREYKRYSAARLIQAHWRSYDCTMDYLHYLADVIIVQSTVRRWLALRIAAEHRIEVITLLQRMVRGFLGRRTAKKESAAIMIQAQWRSIVCIREYSSYRCATMIQSQWRCFVLSRAYKQYCAASKIQALWRSYDCMMDYLHLLADILIVQSAVRRWSAMRKAANRRNQIIVLLQRMGRGFLARQKTDRQLAARKIQKTWRGFVCFADYMFTIADIVIVQSLARRWFALRTYVELRRTARNNAAITIQRNWRCFWHQTEFIVVRHEFRAARAIQSCWRRFWHFSNFIIHLDSAIRIQAITRGYLNRSLYEDKVWGAIVLQCATRVFLAKLTVERCRTVLEVTQASYEIADMYYYSATLIQKTVRGSQARGAVGLYFQVRLLQTVWRGYRVRSAYRQYVAARRIQAFWRCAIHSYYYTRHRSAVCIQSYVRYKKCFREYKKRKASIKLQSAWRAIKAREYIVDLKGKNFAATKIQSAWRGCVDYTNYLFTLADIVKIQSVGRGYLDRKISKNIVLEKQIIGATIIQSAWRSYFCHTNYVFVLDDIIRVQSVMRGFAGRIEFKRRCNERDRQAAIAIQKLWRGYFCYTNYAFVISDVVMVQSTVRRFLATKKLDSLLMYKKHDAAIVMQSAWRGFLCCSNYQIIKYEIIRIQSVFRRFFARRVYLELCEEREHQCAVVIQSAWRSFMHHTNYLFVYADVVKVQSTARRLFATREVQSLRYERDSASATKIQKIARNFLCKRQLAFHNLRAMDIQRYWRGYRGRVGLFIAWKKRVNLIHVCATRIQRIWRGHIQQQNYLYALGSAIQMESVARMFLVKLRVEREMKALVTIQSFWRQSIARTEFGRKRVSIMMLDSVSKAKQLRTSTVKVQKWWKYLKRGQEMDQASVVIQSFFRMAKILLDTEKFYAARLIQSFFRMALVVRDTEKFYAARLIQSFFRMSKALIEAERNRAARVIQRFFLKSRALVRSERRRSALVITRLFKRIKLAAYMRKLRAARVIQQFFLMVKAEVEREIRAEKKRRKFRRKMRNRTKEMDEEMLETAWEKVITHTDCIEVIPNPPRRSGSALSVTNRNHKNIRDDYRRHMSDENASIRLAHSICDIQSVTSKDNRSDNDHRRISRVPSVTDHDVLPSLVNLPRGASSRRHRADDAISEISALTINSHAYRLPPSRLKTWSRREMDDDFSLEEAYIDAEIFSAKERIRTDKRHNKRNQVGKRSSRTKQQQYQQHPQPKVSNNSSSLSQRQQKRRDHPSPIQNRSSSNASVPSQRQNRRGDVSTGHNQRRVSSQSPARSRDNQRRVSSQSPARSRDRRQKRFQV